jgi:hypothetical protein
MPGETKLNTTGIKKAYSTIYKKLAACLFKFIK